MHFVRRVRWRRVVSFGKTYRLNSRLPSPMLPHCVPHMGHSRTASLLLPQRSLLVRISRYAARVPSTLGVARHASVGRGRRSRLQAVLLPRSTSSRLVTYLQRLAAARYLYTGVAAGTPRTYADACVLRCAAPKRYPFPLQRFLHLPCPPALSRHGVRAARVLSCTRATRPRRHLPTGRIRSGPC